jgi:hypothetical protein
MRTPTRLPKTLLQTLAPGEPALVGDLDEEYRRGKSGFWYLGQVVVAIGVGAFKGIAAHPGRVVLTTAVGWAVMLLFFATIGDPLSFDTGYWLAIRFPDFEALVGRNVWMAAPYVPAWLCGFCLASAVVALSDRSRPASSLVAFIASVLVVMCGAAIMVRVYPHPVRVPHPLFYVIFTGLPISGGAGSSSSRS